MSGLSSCLCFMLITSVSAAEVSMMVRQPAVSGRFYPSDPVELRSRVQQFLSQAQVENVSGRVLAIIVPHAGYDYSGQVAAHAFRQIQDGPFKSVVIISPSHQVAYDGISTWPSGAYETPLGMAQVDVELANEIREAMHDPYDRSAKKSGEEWDKKRGLGFYAPAHRREHAIEVEIPFIQEALPDAKIVPMVVGAQNNRSIEQLTRMMIRMMQRPEILFVLSVDLSHFHTYEEAVQLDRAGLHAVERLDAEDFLDSYNAGKTEWDCPVGVVSLLQAADSLSAQGELLKYANSGDVTSDKSRVVGYSAVQISLPPPTQDEDWLTGEEQQKLLKIARETIERHLAGEDPGPADVKSERLQRNGMAFVTLEKQGQLRGCIGYTQPYWPLHETIVRGAIAAATQDARFPPVQSSELGDIEIEISVLTPLREVENWRDITVGLHGLHIEKQGHRGLLLPQVATDYGWTRVEFLEHTCQKAGLPVGAWKEGAKLYTFSAQVFH